MNVGSLGVQRVVDAAQIFVVIFVISSRRSGGARSALFAAMRWSAARVQAVIGSAIERKSSAIREAFHGRTRWYITLLSRNTWSC